jgi:hypothetical protein
MLTLRDKVLPSSMQAIKFPCEQSYYLRLPLVLDRMKICMDFGPYDDFSSSDVPEMEDQQNSLNVLVMGTYLLYFA